MSKAPAMPMFWDAYLADTTHLTTEEHGAYMLLLAAMWRRNGWLSDDDRDNARILGLSIGRWKRVKERLSVFLLYEDGQITQKKLLSIWENTQEKIEKNRKNGSLGGRPVAKRNSDLAKANGSISDKPIETIPEPEPEPLREEDTKVSLSVHDPVHANDLSQAISIYNEAAGQASWPQVQKLSPTRSKQLRARLKDCGGLDGWSVAIGKATASDFICGRTEKPWTGFGFDWLIKSANFTKLMEGNYDNRTGDQTRSGTDGGSRGPRAGRADAFAAVAERLSRDTAHG